MYLMRLFESGVDSFMGSENAVDGLEGIPALMRHSFLNFPNGPYGSPCFTRVFLTCRFVHAVAP